MIGTHLDWPRSWPLLGLLAVFLCAVCARAQENPRDDADRRSKYARQIGEAKSSIHGKTEELRWLAQDFESLGDWGKSDYRILTNDYARVVSEWDAIIRRLRAGDAQQAGRLQESAKPRPDRDWKKRAEARRRQSELWPAEQWAEEVETKWGGTRARAFAPQLIAAKRKASMAWGRYAEAIAPGLDAETRTRLEDTAHELEAEIKVADTIWNMKETQDRVLYDPKVSPAALQQTKELEGMEKELIEISRERLRLEKQQRDWERRRKIKEEEMTRTYQQASDAARKAK